MKKMSEKTFIAICCLIGGIFPIAISILVKYNVIPLFFELPIFITMFTILLPIIPMVESLNTKLNELARNNK